MMRRSSGFRRRIYGLVLTRLDTPNRGVWLDQIHSEKLLCYLLGCLMALKLNVVDDPAAVEAAVNAC